MGEITTGRRGLAAASLIIMASLLAACTDNASGPAPVYMRGASAAPPAWHENRVITVQHGQTLAAIAHAYHVTESAIINTNQLKPPYELRVGARLAIPDHGPPAPPQMAAVPPTTIVTAAALPPAALAPAAAPLTPPHPASNAPPVATGGAASSPASQPPATPPLAQRSSPDVIPLDPPKQAAATPPKPEPVPAPAPAATASGAPPVLAPRNADAALPLPGEAPVAVVAEPDTGGRFPWPVSGRILARYGAAVGGGRNDGINIAAARGTAVRTIDGGTVAYAGNEVRGYGNLVLIKHPNGWISAYAHLDDVLVKKGDTVSAGQVIAKVGDSGGVGEPQLHFELRRGQKAVDPREFLAPAPSASQTGNKAG